MKSEDLQDLVLAGVKWELNENPNGIEQEQKRQEEAPAKDTILQRVATSTYAVKPVAPIAPISLEVAKAMAHRPTDAESLLRMLDEFNHPLKTVATNTVLPHIAKENSGLLLITDIPSAEDDEQGKILTGASGELMDKMLAAIGLSRENVSIWPMLSWRTPGGRTPSRVELDLARPFLDKIILLLKPKVVLTLGTLATSELTGGNLPKDHGKEFNLDSGATAIPVFHPNYLLLKTEAKRDAWVALQLAQKLLKS